MWQAIIITYDDLIYQGIYSEASLDDSTVIFD